jgi:hypothetical protein
MEGLVGRTGSRLARSRRATILCPPTTSPGPQVQAKTQSGVAQLQGQDERNATQIQRVADGNPAATRSSAASLPNTSGALAA